MGSERLSHMFTAEDPTFKGHSSKDKAKNPSSKHSLSHTSGTQPVSVSNGPKSSSPIIKTRRKMNSKYKELSKRYAQQLSHLATTLDAIDSITKSTNSDQYEILMSNKKRVDKLNEELEHLRNSPALHDHIHFDQMKHDIEQLTNDLKTHKMNNDNPNAVNAVDALVALPMDNSDSEENGKNNGEKTSIYF
jgi:hypothetical protein